MTKQIKIVVTIDDSENVDDNQMQLALESAVETVKDSMAQGKTTDRGYFEEGSVWFDVDEL